MKKRPFLLLIAIIILLSSCSVNESNTNDNGSGNNNKSYEKTESTDSELSTDYEYAEYEKYNSYASDNGLQKSKIYIEGKVKSVYEFGENVYCSVLNDDFKGWLVAIPAVEYSDELESLLDEKPVTIFGQYMGYSDVFLMPALFMDKVTVEGRDYFISDLPNYSLSSEITSENALELPTESSTQAPEMKERIIYNDNGITITYKGLSKENNETKVLLLIENLSGKDYTIQTRDMSVNGYMIEPIFSPKITNGNKINTSFDFYNSRLYENGITEIDSLQFKFYIFNDHDDHNKHIQTDIIKLDLSS